MATKLFQPPHGSPAWFHACVDKSQQAPLMEVVDLTPTLANEMLKSNDNNRNIRPSKLQQYSSDMAAGRWAFNGEPIIISREGRLNDGQHRALAAIDANASPKVVMMFGFDRETRTTVDQGTARSACDYLGMDGIENSVPCGAIGRMVIAYERSDGKSLAPARHVTNAEVLERVLNDNGIAAAAHYAVGTGRHGAKFAPGTVIGTAYYLLSRADATRARTFMDQVCNGEGLKRRDPAHSVRERLLSTEKGRERKLALILRAWTFYRRGAQVGPTHLVSTVPFPALV